MEGWKKIAIVVGVIVIVGAIVMYFRDNWVDVANAALRTIQNVIGIDPANHFQLTP